jgi:hypothetical protein
MKIARVVLVVIVLFWLAAWVISLTPTDWP